MKNFADLTEREVLAVAISSEEEDSRIYMSFAEDLKERYPDSAKIFEEMAEEERGHRHMLLELYEQRFGPHLPPIRRDDVKGFLRRRPIWLTKNLSLDTIRKEVETMEFQAERFYVKAAEQAQDVGVRRLLGDLAEAEKGHEKTAERLTDQILKPDVRDAEDRTRAARVRAADVQPGLAGLMDGSVSTLAPLFAAAFATHHNWQTFLVGLAASIGAGISMGFAEALSDDGSLTGRGSPWLRGVTCGSMTTLGGLGHTVPYLVPDFLGQCVLDRDRDRRHRRVLRIVGDRLYPRPLHGYAVPAGGVPDRARRRHRARGRYSDRGGLAASAMTRSRFGRTFQGIVCLPTVRPCGPVRTAANAPTKARSTTPASRRSASSRSSSTSITWPGDRPIRRFPEGLPPITA